jgi:predicted aspartyl protease
MLSLRSAVLALAAAGVASPVGAQLPATTATFGGATVVEVPYRLVHGLVTIPVSVNGSAPLQLILDSGAPVLVIRDTALATKLNARIIGQARVGGAGDGEPKVVPLATGMTTRVGSLEVQNVTAIIGGVEEAIPAVDGVIGAAFFNNAVVEFDFDRRVVRFHDPRSSTLVMTGDTLALRVDPSLHSFVRGTVVVNGTAMAVDLHLDTGSRQALSVARKTMNRYGAKPTHAIQTVVAFGSRGPARGELIRASELRLGRVTLPAVAAIIMEQEASDEARVGLPALERFHVWIDYPGKRVVLRPRANVADPFAANTTGIVLRPGRDSAVRVVADVAAGTPAHEAGLQVGDTIVAVNGRELLTEDERFVRTQVAAAPPGTPLVLRIRRAGAVIERRVMPRVLLP